MAIINKITGFNGFTIDIDPNNPSINLNGEVKSCIVAITFPHNEADVEFTISRGREDFAVKTGDGQIIPCFDPQVIYVNRDNAIIQFSMEDWYPANSPLSLIYRSDTAGFTVDPIAGTTKPFEVNSVSGHFAFTVEGYNGRYVTDIGFDGNAKEVGLVTKVMAVIPFTYSITSVNAVMSNGADDWGIRMGNGSIIPLQDPEIVSVNQNNFVALLSMREGFSYPSNSPGILVYRSESARIEIIPKDDDNNFYPVQNIYDVPTNVVSGTTVDLNCAKVEPFNASVQHINWSVVSGNSELVDKHYLHISKGGQIVINATIEDGLTGDDLHNDYNQRFIMTAEQNVITKLSDPIPEIKAYVGEIDHSIAVVAECTTDKINYQWYKNKVNSYENATAITKDGTNAEYFIPSTLEKGDSYFFCIISSDGAVSVKSKICHIYASIRCTNITIQPLDTTMGWESTRQMHITQFPSDADLPHVDWFSSNDNIASFDDEIDPNTGLLKYEGLLRSKFPQIKPDLSKSDVVTITAITTDILGNQLTASIDIMIETFVPVQDIVGLELNVNPNNTYTLSATVLPNNATNKTIKWSVSDRNNTDISITGDRLTIPNSVIPLDHQVGCVIMATIDNGSSTHNKYQKEFSVFVTHGFVPVTDIHLDTDNSISYDSNVHIDLKASVLPTGASKDEITWSILSGAGELHGNTLIVDAAGDTIVRATVKNGGGTIINQIDFSKDFVFKCTGIKNIGIDNVVIEFTRNKKVVTADGDGNKIEEVIEVKDNVFDPFQQKFGDIETIDLVTENITVIQVPQTGKTATVTLTNVQFKEEPVGYGEADWVTPEDFWSTDMQIINDPDIVKIVDNRITVNRSKIITGNLYMCNIRVAIEKGISSTEDLILDKEIFIQTNNIEPFVPLEDVGFDIRPGVLRALSPILISVYNSITPINASVYNEENNHIKLGELVGNDLVEMNYSMEMFPDVDKGECGVQPVVFFGSRTEMGFTVDPLPIFVFDKPEFYLYPWNPGRIKVRIGFNNSTVENINSFNKYYPKKIEWFKEFDLTFLPPFIPVDTIIGMPSNIYVNQPCILPGEVENIVGNYNYNPAWDDEDVTNKEIIYSIISNGCGATLVGKTLTAARTGSVTIRATVREGLAERVEWYADNGDVEETKVQEGRDFTKDFVITAVTAEAQFSRDIVTLTFTDNSQLGIKTLGELKLLCTPEPSNSTITIRGTTFRKDQVKYANFYVDVHNDMNIVFSSTTVSQTEIDSTDTTIKLTNGINSNPFSVSWSIVSGTGGTLSSNDQTTFTTLTIDHSQLAVGGSIKVKCTVIPKKTNGTADNEGKVEREIIFNKVASRADAWLPNPNLTSLENFGRNFTNLLTINRIPTEVRGTKSLRNFLRGCTSFNSALVIPNGVTGDSCLENFLRGCTSFNSAITIPDGLTGIAAMHGFLMDCTHFNRPISIPSAITGSFCLKKFMYGCSSFNQPITIPRGVSGFSCMFEFMAFCSAFNQPITLPDDVGNIVYHDDFDNKDYVNGYQLDLMLYNANNYHSTITVPAATGLHGMVAEKTFGSAKFDSPMIVNGITLDGPGANSLCFRDDTNKITNNYELNDDGGIPWAPFRHITNLD